MIRYDMIMWVERGVGTPVLFPNHSLQRLRPRNTGFSVVGISKSEYEMYVYHTSTFGLETPKGGRVTHRICSVRGTESDISGMSYRVH